MDYIITEKEKKIKLSYLRSRIKHQSWSYLHGLDAEERRVVEVLGTKPLLSQSILYPLVKGLQLKIMIW